MSGEGRRPKNTDTGHQRKEEKMLAEREEAEKNWTATFPFLDAVRGNFPMRHEEENAGKMRKSAQKRFHSIWVFGGIRGGRDSTLQEQDQWQWQRFRLQW